MILRGVFGGAQPIQISFLHRKRGYWPAAPSCSTRQRDKVHTNATRRQLCAAYPAFSLAAASRAEAVSSPLRPMKLDSHLHVWPSVQDYSYEAGKEPPMPGSAEDLIHLMDEAGVQGALIVQPINLQFDHSYVSSIIKKYPGRFVGCCLADPAPGGGGVKELERLLTEEGYRAVRFNPYLWPEGQPMTNDVGREMFAKAGEYGAYVGFMCFKGLDLHIADVQALCEAYPNTPVLMDHFAFCKGVNDPNFKDLLGLAMFPQVSVKVSAQFRVAEDPTWPYVSTGAQVRELINAYGVERLVWGSDFPFVTEECGYKPSSFVLEKCGAALSDTELEAIMGRNLQSMFPGGFYET